MGTLTPPCSNSDEQYTITAVAECCMGMCGFEGQGATYAQECIPLYGAGLSKVLFQSSGDAIKSS